MSALNARPTAGELVQAVRELLEEQVLPDGRPPRAYDVRVAVTALRIVERELAGDLAGEHRARLDRLGLGDDGVLAAALRRREVPAERLADVRAVLLEDAVAALRVADPDHLVAPQDR